MAAKRVYWAIEALAVSGTPSGGVADGATKGGGALAKADFVSGVQSIGITTTFNLEQVFQLGQLSLYQDIEEVPDVEVTVERVLDDDKVDLSISDNVNIKVVKSTIQNLANISTTKK